MTRRLLDAHMSLGQIRLRDAMIPEAARTSAFFEVSSEESD